MSQQAGHTLKTPQDLDQNPANPVNRAAAEIARFGTTLRAASPAKRSRSELDGDGEASDGSENSMDGHLGDGVTRSPSKRHNSNQLQSPLPSRTKSRPMEMDDPRSDSLGAPHSGGAVAGSTSSESNAVPVSSPPTSVDTDGDVHITGTPPPFGEQRDKLHAIMSAPLQEGQKGHIVPNAWLEKILAKASPSGMQKENYSKQARESAVGPLDTRSIIAPTATGSGSQPLKDGEGHSVVLLATGQQLGNTIEVLPEEAWQLVVSWHGISKDTPTIVRFVVNTNFEREGLSNLQYELYPTLFTVQKLVNEDGQGLESLGDRGKRAVQLVASRAEKYQSFLTRCKAALGIPITDKVQLWKVIETLQASTGRAGIPTPTSSRDASPAPLPAPTAGLPARTVDSRYMTTLEEGTQRELLDLPDETANQNYNGNFRLGEIGFPETQKIIVEMREPSQGQPNSQTALVKAERSTPPSRARATPSAAASRPSANTRSARKGSRGLFSRNRRDAKGRPKGSVGLQNLGNTCYMNSALQCIRNVEELTTYFLKEKYKEEINHDNPLGHGGAIAKTYAGLVASIYAADNSFSPRNFKTTVGRHQPLFSGYGQQDSQEFVGFLLDALHEDLNRVVKKPYVENPDSDDARVHDPEYIKELGEVYRTNHRKRNDSVAMDLFNGFYKNTMICPACDKVSVTFDPFSQVTLQLPVDNTFAHTIIVAPLDRPPVRLNVDIDKNATFSDLKHFIAARVQGVTADHFVFAEDYNQRIFKIFQDLDCVSEAGIQSADKIVAYELDDTPTNWPPLEKKKRGILGFGALSSSSERIPDMTSTVADRMAVPVYNRIRGHDGRLAFTLHPFFILITREEAMDADAILRKCLLKLDTMTTTDMFKDCDVDLPKQSGQPDIKADSRIPKIQTQSVEGDEDFVDVSMADAHPKSSHVSPPSSPSLRAKILHPDCFLTSNLTDAFDISVLPGSTELITTGYSSFSSEAKTIPLKERAYPRVSRRASNSSWSNRSSSRNNPRWQRGEDASSECSEDELGQNSDNGLSQSTPDIAEPTDDESDGGDTSTTEQSNLSVRHKSIRQSNVRGSIKRLGQSVRNSMRRSKSRGKRDEYVIRLGDALILDWNPPVFDGLFCGSEDEPLKGEQTDHNMPLIADPELDKIRERRSKRKSDGVTLEQCFSETSKSEVLSQDNAWYCPRCKEHRRATKTLELWTVPDILIVHLKRFSGSGSGGRSMSNKIELRVDFPVENLDLTERVGQSDDKSLEYDLFAVDNHYGGLGGGHYTAYAKNFLDGKWYDFNDTFVSGVSSKEVVSHSAYLLFYRRRTPRHLGPQSLQMLMEETITSDTEYEDSGKDQAGDSTSSGSSDESGTLGPSSRAIPSAEAAYPSSSVKPPEYDEAISMDADEPMASLEEQAANRAYGPPYADESWSFAGVGRGFHAPPGSEDGANGGSDSGAASDQPDAGGDLQDRFMEDSDDDTKTGYFVQGQMAHLPPGSEDQDAIEQVVPMEHEGDEAVTEIRLGDNEDESGHPRP